MPQNPWSRSLTLATHAVAYNLFDLIQAADITVKRRTCCRLQIQLDPAAGAAKLYGGDAQVAANRAGWAIVAGQYKPWEGIQQNLYDLGGIWLTSDTDGVQINVEYVVQ